MLGLENVEQVAHAKISPSSIDVVSEPGMMFVSLIG
jgi:hypothetical protein